LNQYLRRSLFLSSWFNKRPKIHNKYATLNPLVLSLLLFHSSNVQHDLIILPTERISRKSPNSVQWQSNSCFRIATADLNALFPYSVGWSTFC
jgi:hypothetical protein